MKKGTVFILTASILVWTALLFTNARSAGPPALQWDAVTTYEDGNPAVVTGYNAYNVTSGGHAKVNGSAILPAVCVAGVCTWTLPVSPKNGDQFVVTAFDAISESLDSNVATYTTRVKNPGGLIIKIP